MSSLSNPSPPPPTLVLGLGNDILTDDAIGLVLAQAMHGRFAGNPGVEVVACSEMGLSLLDFMVGRGNLVVLDSVQTGHAQPGHVHEVGEEDIHTLPGMSPHFLGVGEILRLGRLLELPMPERVRLLAIEVEDPFTLGSRLTDSLQKTLPRIIERVADTVRALASDSAGQGSREC